MTKKKQLTKAERLAKMLKPVMKGRHRSNIRQHLRKGTGILCGDDGGGYVLDHKG